MHTITFLSETVSGMTQDKICYQFVFDNCLQNMTAESFSPGTKGIKTNLVKLIRREQVEMFPWWTSS